MQPDQRDAPDALTVDQLQLAATAIQAWRRMIVARRKFKMTRTVTTRLQAVERGRASRVLVAVMRATRGLLRFGRRMSAEADTIEERAKLILRAGSVGLSVEQQSRRLYLGLGALLLVGAITAAVLLRDPQCPLVGVAIGVSLLALRPTSRPPPVLAVVRLAIICFALLVANTAVQISLGMGVSDESLAHARLRIPYSRRWWVGYWSASAAVASIAIVSLVPLAGRSALPSMPMRPAVLRLWFVFRLFYTTVAALQLGFAAAAFALEGLSAARFATRLIISLLSAAVLGMGGSYRLRQELRMRVDRVLIRRRERIKLHRQGTMAAHVARKISARLSKPPAEALVPLFCDLSSIALHWPLRLRLAPLMMATLTTIPWPVMSPLALAGARRHR